VTRLRLVWRRWRLSAFCLIVLCGAAVTIPQELASVEGYVKDQMGGRVIGAQVTVTSQTAAMHRTVLTNSEGHYFFNGLPPGTYDLSISATGFRNYNVQQVFLSAGQHSMVSAVLDVGKMAVADRYGWPKSAHEVSDIFFLDTAYGWIAVHDHDEGSFHLYRTVDGGTTWNQAEAPNAVVRIYFTGSERGWALSREEQNEISKQPVYRLWQTLDGGMTWKRVSTHPLIPTQGAWIGDIDTFAFDDDLHGWFVGATPNFFGLIIQTGDGGNTVHELKTLDASVKGCAGVVVSKEIGVFIYGYGYLLHSTDGGETWARPLEATTMGLAGDKQEISAALFKKGGRGWLVGRESAATVLETNDSGLHWTRVLQIDGDPTLTFSSITSWDDDHACAALESTLLYCTSDGGDTWQKRDVLPPPVGEEASFFPALILLKSGRGWALRAGGYLYQTVDGGQTWREFDPVKGVSRH
jgi:photosystem II stability/assembly factor-like uncharacterized protein